MEGSRNQLEGAMMSKIPTIGLLLCLACSLAVRAEDRSLIMDGVFWSTLTPIEKVRFIQGFTVGHESGFLQGEAQTAADLADIPGVKGARTKAATTNPNAFGGMSYTFGQLVAGMDECYKDFRNQKLKVDVCFTWTVFGIKGEDEELRTNYLQESRRIAAQE
jgi:hypothetical protein